MDVLQIIDEINNTYPEIDKNNKATEKQITDTEIYINKPLPQSYKKFVKYFSNGIFILDAEPICGVGRSAQDTPCGVIESSKVLVDISVEDKNCYIIDEQRFVEMKNLLCFTAGSALDMSHDHWAFICDETPANNEYRVGYVSQSSGNIVKVLSNFEEWLTIFWNANKDEDAQPTSVFHSLYKTFDERTELLSKK